MRAQQRRQAPRAALGREAAAELGVAPDDRREQSRLQPQHGDGAGRTHRRLPASPVEHAALAEGLSGAEGAERDLGAVLLVDRASMPRREDVEAVGGLALADDVVAQLVVDLHEGLDHQFADGLGQTAEKRLLLQYLRAPQLPHRLRLGRDQLRSHPLRARHWRHPRPRLRVDASRVHVAHRYS